MLLAVGQTLPDGIHTRRVTIKGFRFQFTSVSSSFAKLLGAIPFVYALCLPSGRRCRRTPLSFKLRLRGHRSLVPCEVMFGPLRRRWSRRIATTASADFRSAQRCLRTRGPAFRASPTHRYANRISPDKELQNEPSLRFVSKQRVVSLPKLSIYLPTAISSSVSRCHARSPGIAGLMKFLLVVWQVLA